MKVYTEDLMATAEKLIEDYCNKHGKKPSHIELTQSEFEIMKQQLKTKYPYMYSAYNVSEMSHGDMTLAGCIIVVK